MSYRSATLFVLAFGAISPGPALSQGGAAGRDLAGIADEQEILRRQLQRLRLTMEALIPRLEAEGRTHALELLRQGLGFLEERPADSGSLTLDELMDRAREGVQSGQAMQSLESQERIIRGLERLLAILLDRQSLETLQESIEELRELRRELERLSSREAEIQRATEALREASATPEQEALEAALSEMVERQRELLAQNEELGRSSGLFELEAIERLLEELLRRQGVDRAVLESWSPPEREPLARAREPLAAARRSAAQAERLRQAAQLLREGAGAASQAPASDGLDELKARLETAAEREERHQRASGDDAARQAAEALRASAGELRRAGSDAAARQAAASAMEQRAAALEEEAARLEAAAGERRGAASAELERAAEGESPAARAATQARSALERAADASRPADAARAAEEAQAALDRALEELGALGPALSASQEEQARASERLGRSLEGLEAGASAGARENLERAAAAMREASRAARGEEAPAAARAAAEAEAELERAREGLARAREEGRAKEASTAPLAGEQRELAERAAQARDDASRAELAEDSGAEARRALEEARQAMERAAGELEAGKSASAAGSQRQAVEALQRAQSAASGGVRPSSDAQRKEAGELAEEQRQVEKELLDLATRERERKDSKAAPSLERAGASAEQASGALDEGDLEEAEEQEERVQKEVQEAIRQLNEEEESYQRLRQEELLFRIAEEVATLLEGHRKAMEETRAVDSAREPGQRPSRAQRLALRRISKEEGALAARSGEIAVAIGAEESVVFAQMMHEVRQDLERIARDLDESGDYQTGSRVQALQQDAEESITWVLEALKQEQRDRQRQAQEQQQGQQGEQGQNRPRLVPDVAELKLLRRMEVETLDRLDQLLLLQPEGDDLGDVQRLAERHERTSELFKQFRERLGIPEPEAPEPEAEVQKP